MKIDSLKLTMKRPQQAALLFGLLVAFLLYLLNFTYSFLGMNQQYYLGWVCFFIILLMYRLKLTRRQPWRLLFLIVAAFLGLRYIQWRTFDTLLYTGPGDFFGMSLLYLAEVYGLLIYFMGMFVNLWPMESDPAPFPEDVEKLPTVDIYIPTYNEPDDIIRITATAATQIDYPKEKLRIFILDDGGSLAKRSHPENGMAAWERHYRLRQMAQELGIGYFTRETNQQAKAGNINHALHYSDGEIVLILDCDHVPTKDILRNTIGHFILDPKLFLVQTPHFFINPTPIEKNLEGMANPSAESDMFYRRIHPALDFWNASYFCGSAALLRKEFLMEVGGICGTTITEDCETAFQLHARGYNSRYVNRPMVCGLSPESYDDYVIQRSRWAQGMVQLVLLNNPLQTQGLSFPQRLAYFNSSFFWLFGFPRFIYFIAPAMYLILGWNVYHASSLQIIAFTLPYVFSIYLVMDFFYAGSRQPFFSEIYESVQSLFLMPAVISVLLNPWKPTFKVTPKGMTNEKNYLSPLAAPFFLVIGINVIAVLLAIDKWIYEPLLRDVIAVTVVWCFYNLYLSIVSLGAFWERRQIRKFYRILASGVVNVFFHRMGAVYQGEVRDVSLTGIGLEIELPFQPREHEQVLLEVKDGYGREYRFDSRIQRAINKSGKYFCGTEFISGQTSYVDVVSYVFGDSTRWQENWNRKSASSGTYLMIWYFIKTGVSGFVGGIIPLTLLTVKRLWEMAVIVTTTSVVRDRVLALVSWTVYHFYLFLASLVELLDRKQVRKLQRMHASGKAVLYFPRLDATLQGELSDVSLTGMGVMLSEIPFAFREQERVTIKMTSENGELFQFPCVIQRTINRDGKVICGAEFVVDTYIYPRIVRFVYGGSMQMLYYILAPETGLTAQGKAVASKVAVRVVRKVWAWLSFVFLNPQAGSSGKK